MREITESIQMFAASGGISVIVALLGAAYIWPKEHTRELRNLRIKLGGLGIAYACGMTGAITSMIPTMMTISQMAK